jgi:hypothetical protein
VLLSEQLKTSKAFLDACGKDVACITLLQDGRVREQKIKLRHGDTLIINTVEGNCMMNFLKRFIAGGFQVRQAAGTCYMTHA